MDRQSQPVDVWPRWLHLSCLGCSSLVAVVLVAGSVTALILALRMNRPNAAADVARGEVTAPIRSLANGSVGVVRATGYIFDSAAYGPGGMVVAVGWREPSLSELFSEVLRAAASGEDAQGSIISTLTGDRIIAIDPLTGTIETIASVAPSKGRPRVMESWCLAPDGRWAAGVEAVYASADMEGEPQRFVRGYDVEKRTFTWQWSVPRREACFVLACLPDGSGAIASVSPISKSGDRGQEYMALVRADGSAVRLTAMPEPWDDIFVPNARTAVVVSGLDDKPSELIVNLTTGGTEKRKVTVLPGVRPGRLARDEILVPMGDCLGALSWRAARIRRLTWPSEGGSEQEVELWHPAPCARRKWAVTQIEGGDSDPVAAVDLSTGRFYAIAPPEGSQDYYSVVAGHPRQLRALLRCRAKRPEPYGGSLRQLVDVYLDQRALKRNKGVLDPAALLSRYEKKEKRASD